MMGARMARTMGYRERAYGNRVGDVFDDGEVARMVMTL